MSKNLMCVEMIFDFKIDQDWKGKDPWQDPVSVKILDNIESNISNLRKIIDANECTINNVWRSTSQATQKKIKYNEFREWLMTCPIPYVQEELHDFDDDSIVFKTSKIKNKG